MGFFDALKIIDDYFLDSCKTLDDFIGYINKRIMAAGEVLKKNSGEW